MNISLGKAEERFADIIWNNEPLTTKELIYYGKKEFQWKRTTTYTVLKKLCNKGLFTMNDSIVTSKISRDSYYASMTEQFVDSNFHGSLPAFIAAFSSRKKLSETDLQELQDLIDKMK